MINKVFLGTYPYQKRLHIQVPGKGVSFCGMKFIGIKSRLIEEKDKICSHCLQTSTSHYRGYDLRYRDGYFQIWEENVRITNLCLATRAAAERVIDTYLKSKENEILRSSR